MRIYADTRSARYVKTGNSSRRWHKGDGILCVDAALDGVTAQLDVLLPVTQLVPRCNANLLLHNIDAGNHLRNGMFYLHACVHLDEIELVFFVEKLERACAAIAKLEAGFGAALTDLVAQPRLEFRCRRLFDDFLVTPLHRAITFPKKDCVFVLVCQHLYFDVAWVFEEFFEIHHWIAECR